MAELSAHHHGHRQRLRERFAKAGLSGLADHEVVELLLTLASPRADVKQPAKALFARFGSLRDILDATPQEVSRVEGIGPVTPVALQIIKAAATLYLQQATGARESLAHPEHLASFWRMRIGTLGHEAFEVAYLDSALRLLRDGGATYRRWRRSTRSSTSWRRTTSSNATSPTF